MNKFHEIYKNFPYIEDEIFNLIYIPLVNRDNAVSTYTVSNLSLKDKLLIFKYHELIIPSKIEKSYSISNLGTSMHEIVIGKKAPKGYVIDHIDGDGLLNTEENLRYATQGLNAQNKEKKPNATSKYFGVSFDNKMNKWRPRISIKGKAPHLGAFEDELDAAKVYDIYAVYHYRESLPKTNELLTKKEIEDIRLNGIPKKYQKKIKERDLPKNIYLTKSNAYRVEITFNKKRYNKIVKTLEEAIFLKNKFLKEIEENKEITKYSKEITRNTDGLAIIYMSNGLECLVDDDHWYDLTEYKWNCYLNGKNKIYSYQEARLMEKQQNYIDTFMKNTLDLYHLI